MTGESVGGDDPSIQYRVDTTDLGWVQTPDGSKDPAMFILASDYIAMTSVDADRIPDWFPLSSVTGLDALDAPIDGIQTIELMMRDGRRMVAGWHEAFCGQVVDSLVATLAASPAALEPIEPVASPEVPRSPAPPPVAAQLPPAEVLREATESGPASEGRPLDLTAAALVLEDVTYLGGYPGEDKKRKGCTATMTREDLEVSGPKGIRFRIAWEVVRSLEAQNADEARFRMNTKIHRDATALVLECDQGVTLLLEARDCPTIPLRGAIAQLIDGLPVVVV